MKITRIAPNKIPQYSDKDIAYQTLDKRYNGFYKYRPEIKSITDVIAAKKKQPIDRKLLTEVIEEEYGERSLSEAQKKNLANLKKKNGWTVITAHQPGLFTGPLYFVFKIISAIKMSRQLSEDYPKETFTPVFISGGEDHDFEEINHAHLFGKIVEWEKEADGPVGRLEVDASLSKTLDEFLEILGDKNHGPEISELLRNSLAQSKTYGEFNFHIVNELFSDYGVLVVNMDNHRLKRVFAPFIKKEITEQRSRKLVMSTQDQLSDAGFSSQAYPREINFFYLTEDGRRMRIEKTHAKYQVLDTNISWTQEEILSEINLRPENFSPNVVMRPIYQEVIFPNLAYIGGGGEIAYWLERKRQFEYFDIPFPMLVRRNSAMLIPTYISKQMEELEIDHEELFHDSDHIINRFIADSSDVDINLGREKSKISEQMDIIAKKAEIIDPTISTWIQAEKVKQEKLLDQMESRIKRTIKKKEEIKVKQIQKLKKKLFPDNGLQERHDNFFQYYHTHGRDLIELLLKEFNPFELGMLIVEL